MSVWDDYHRFRISPERTCEIRHRDVVRLLDELRSLRPEAMKITELGLSFEGRSILLVSLGTGPHKVLAWSQMHGNEPTHTAALLDLISFLQSSPSDPIVESILTNCSLSFVLMLNPDGAERYTRRNAQELDINRDALELQSAEGRLLKKAVEELEPQFALNLHNQSPRTAVGSGPPRVAAVSLLVPPIDAVDTQTESVTQAKQLAACFLGAVESHCPDMISRYDADFMPRCFGEWVQQQGVATLTVEAGGWTTASIEGTPLAQIHWLGLVAVLEAIAEQSYLQAEPERYDALPRSNEHYLYDVVLQNGTLVGSDTQPSYRANIGINFAELDDNPLTPTGGQVVDIGDLSVTTGKKLFDCSKQWCLPGRIVFREDVTPLSLPDEQGIGRLFQEGVTSIIGKLDLSNLAELKALEGLSSPLPVPINLGFVADLTDCENIGLIARSTAAGLLGVIDESISAEHVDLIDSLPLARVGRDCFSTTHNRPETVSEYVEATLRHAKLLNLPNDGRVKLGGQADIVFLRRDDQTVVESPVDWSDLQQVMVAGNVVWTGTELAANRGGRLLTTRFAGVTH